MSIKSKVKKLIHKGKPIDGEKLYQFIKPYEFVSFDLFDTLVKRNVQNPTDLFDIMELTLGDGFKEKRIAAETKARELSGGAEVTLKDIYSQFDTGSRDEYAALEIETEVQTIVPNRPMIDVYNECLSDGKKTFIVSDMYLPENAIERILEKCGIKQVSSIYLSSAYGCFKRSGELFRKLLEQERLNPERMIHIGDSIRGDYCAPRKLGIHSVLIPRYSQNITFRGMKDNSTIQRNYLNQFINNTFDGNPDPYYQFGYALFGKLLYGYVNWIHDEAKKRGIKKLFFLSRDGYIMKKAYEACIHDDEIEIEYLEVSRRSLRVPILWQDCSNEIIYPLIKNTRLVSVKSVFDVLGLTAEAFLPQIKECGLEPETIFYRDEIGNRRELDSLLDQIRPHVISNSKSEFENAYKYLKQKTVRGNIGVIDIGYAGSMQRYIQQCLDYTGIDYSITGFYLCVADLYIRNLVYGNNLDLNGYVFDFMHNPNSTDIRSSFVGLLETLFLERGGSVKRYMEKNGLMVAERYPFELEENSGNNGALKNIQSIQNGAIDFVKKAAEDKVISKLNYSAVLLFEGIYLTGSDPTPNDLRLFGDFPFYDDTVLVQLAKPKPLMYYLTHINKAKQDFIRSPWKTGFMKRLLRIKLPYQRIYNELREKYRHDA